MTRYLGSILVLVLSVLVCGQPQTNPPESSSDQQLTEDTSPQKPYSKEMLSLIESNLLELFGFTSRPPRLTKKRVVPQHMIDLYKEHAGIVGEVTLSSGRSLRRPHSGNTIHTFSSKEDNAKHEHTRHFKFNISSLDDSNVLRGTEFRLYRSGMNESIITNDTLRQKIEIHEVIHPGSKSQKAITRLLDVLTVHPKHSKWESFDVSDTVHKWRQSPHLNHGILVKVKDTKGVLNTSKHVRLRRSVEETDQQWVNMEPLLITYSDDLRHSSDVIKSRTKRSNKKRKRKRVEKKRNQLCRRYSLHVDFEEVGWKDWIVAPNNYNAYYCKGDCPFYMPDRLNRTNHAIVQALVHEINEQAVPKPCCVPIELSKISLLYFNQNEEIVLKDYSDMVVKTCGCR